MRQEAGNINTIPVRANLIVLYVDQEENGRATIRQGTIWFEGMSVLPKPAEKPAEFWNSSRWGRTA
ncbi:hypothetical protein MES5069_550247 [Mesorhizobium escarrei]|uniref:Uncharacterized protein n=1 Tax=Mesorhizobium escarrei TaxID=666018 RepID=A0ABN8KEX6_9HYPH|nr:hypothetical protein MES5069_550247 [Mesorhizobium escarrei]